MRSCESCGGALSEKEAHDRTVTVPGETYGRVKHISCPEKPSTAPGREHTLVDRLEFRKQLYSALQGVALEARTLAEEVTSHWVDEGISFEILRSRMENVLAMVNDDGTPKYPSL